MSSEKNPRAGGRDADIPPALLARLRVAVETIKASYHR